jgi:hypothetical protein
VWSNFDFSHHGFAGNFWKYLNEQKDAAEALAKTADANTREDGNTRSGRMNASPSGQTPCFSTSTAAPVDLKDYRELLLGCGNRVTKEIKFQFVPSEFLNLTRLDIDPGLQARRAARLERAAAAVPRQSFQRDPRHRHPRAHRTAGRLAVLLRAVLGVLADPEAGRLLRRRVSEVGFAMGVGRSRSHADPSPHSLIFLDQNGYGQIGTTPMTDYRHVYKANFRTMVTTEDVPAAPAAVRISGASCLAAIK